MTVDDFDVRAAYGGAASAWAAGPAAVYSALAETLVHDCPLALDRTQVLDFGAGTGATSAVVSRAGARVIAADLSFDMLRAERDTRPPAVTADVLRLPFPAGAFDVALGAFVLSHVPEPVHALTEVARTVRGRGVVMTLGFDARWSFPEKAIIEQVMVGYGMELPPWYRTFKCDVEPLTALPDRLVSVAGAAGLTDVVVYEHAVDVDVRTADAIIAWRLGFPVYASFVAELDPIARADVLAALHDAIGTDPSPLVPEVLVLVGRVASDR